MTITGYQFDKAKVTALHDSMLYHHLAHKQSAVIRGIGAEMAVTTSNLTATVDTGVALITGRMVEITSPEAVEIPANSRGYLVIYIDLSVENTTSGIPGEASYEVQNNQVSVRFVTNLTQQDLFQGGLIYTFNLGRIETSTSSIIRFTADETLEQPNQLHQLTKDDGVVLYAYDTNLNNHIKTGIRWINPKCTNSPFPNNHGFVETIRVSSGMLQIARSWQGGWKVFRRAANGYPANTIWDPWVDITPVDPSNINLINTGWKSAGFNGVQYKRMGDLIGIRYDFTGTGGTIDIGTIPASLWRPPQEYVFLVQQYANSATANSHLIVKANGALRVADSVKGAVYKGQLLIMM
ncbi:MULTISPECIES: DUF859 domain-containing protein [unclassified Streptococcus]|uniref:DUF859 domain-containing protein n=1 Tax=unclassified Streptococcus TaxID=2608887 RepID=UPI00211B424F|nr:MULTISPECIES: DUF859 domain-containing protein [unclassified Streptococcus]MCQ9211663.1 DUF859 domain-containing protein [Streptococcus sp. B01]MCQ9215055.1 DUF859 domain-containing protein [Streptococcus sp. O1]